MYRALLLAGIFFMINNGMAANPLEDYRWKNRLIVASVSSKQDRDVLTALLLLNHQKLMERALIVIDISPEPIRISGAVRLGEKQTISLRERFGLDKGISESIFFLIGKDGGEKARHLGMLNLNNWFDLTDSMPMRQKEVRLY
jgi:hypothetical protein